MAIAVEVPKISDLLDKHLELKRLLEGEREITGGATWRASQLGKCLRRQFLQYHDKRPALFEDSPLSLRRFEVGHGWSKQFSLWFNEMGFDVEEEIEMFDADLDIGAHADFIVNLGEGHRFGIELKSVNSKWFWYRTRYDNDTATTENMLQAAAYDMLMRRQGETIPWFVLTVSKDDLTMAQDMVTDEHRKEVSRRLLLLNSAITADDLPCTCTDPAGEWGGAGWKYCPYFEGSPSRDAELDAALEHSKSRVKNKGKFVPQGVCCHV